MLTRRFALGCFLLLSIGLVADAQVVEYRYSGTLWFTRGENVARFGTRIEGTATINHDAVPDIRIEDNSRRVGQSAQWWFPDSTIDGATNGGYTLGTNIDGGFARTTLEDYLLIDDERETFQQQTIQNYFSANGRSKHLLISAQIYGNPEADGIAELSDLNPLADEDALVIIRDYDNNLGTRDEAFYYLQTFERIYENITIGGIDTGVQDFAYAGSTVTETIEALAVSAPSDGKFLNDVRKLTKELEKAGLITKTQQEAIRQAAEQAVQT